MLKNYIDNTEALLTLWVVWISAFCGIFYQYTFHEQYKWLETVLYLMVGVCPAIVAKGMLNRSGLEEMAIGGFLYIVGVPFFKCDGVIPFAHSIWHLFVLLGAYTHYSAVSCHLYQSHESIYLTPVI